MLQIGGDIAEGEGLGDVDVFELEALCRERECLVVNTGEGCEAGDKERSAPIEEELFMAPEYDCDYQDWNSEKAQRFIARVASRIAAPIMIRQLTGLGLSMCRSAA